MQIVTEKDLKNEISDMRERFPRLQDSELFVAWFLKSFVIEREDEAVRALVGGSRDKSLDALLIDDAARVIFLVQGKYRQKASGATEHRSDVTAFADLANTFSNDDSFKSWVKDLDAGVAGKALEARQRIKKRGYRLQLYYVTTGRCSSSLSQEAERMARQADAPADTDVVPPKRHRRDGDRHLDLFPKARIASGV